jgi:hypothetical protein
MEIIFKTKNQKQLEAAVKEVLGRLPDIGDTLLMRAWFEIQPSAYKADPASNEAQVRLFNRNATNQEFEAS